MDKIKEKYDRVSIKNFDISNHSLIEKFIDECGNTFDNKINVLINNAGITSDNLSIRMKEDEWNKVINLNLTSSFLLTKNVIKRMLKNRMVKLLTLLQL